jgi:hypothetical protein
MRDARNFEHANYISAPDGEKEISQPFPNKRIPFSGQAGKLNALEQS